MPITRREGPLRVATPILIAALLALGFAQPATAQKTRSPESAQTAPAVEPSKPAAVPKPLSAADAELYRKIFKLHERGLWADADKARAQVSDPILIGATLAQRYLDPRYKPRLPELKDWLARYPDLAEADAILKLARDKAGKKAGEIKGPKKVARLEGARIRLADDTDWESDAFNDAKRPAKVRELKAAIRAKLRAGDLDAARALANGKTAGVLSAADREDIDVATAALLFARGEDEAALKLAEPVADRSGDRLLVAHWITGLAHWRLGHVDQAQSHFEALGNASGLSPWVKASGAYWAARAALAGRRPEQVNRWLEIAAAYPRTFYGMLARRALGQIVEFNWESQRLTEDDVAMLQRFDAAKRALALLQIGERDRAEQELRRLQPRASAQLNQALLGLANASKMPELAVRLGSIVAADDGRMLDSATYPLPDWKPAGGWTVDPALIFAFARQESGFDPDARSPSGALGLMQLMPATARTVGGKMPVEKMMEPATNLALGQRYVQRLLDEVKGDLFLLVAAYNTGPGNLSKWVQQINHKGDPLLFIESMPSRETRSFVERVITNLWVYRDRMGLPAPSLDAIVAGDWPLYDGAERPSQVSRNAAR